MTHSTPCPTQISFKLHFSCQLPYQELKMRSDENSQNSRLESLLGTRNYLGRRVATILTIFINKT